MITQIIVLGPAIQPHDNKDGEKGIGQSRTGRNDIDLLAEASEKDSQSGSGGGSEGGNATRSSEGGAGEAGSEMRSERGSTRRGSTCVHVISVHIFLCMHV